MKKIFLLGFVSMLFVSCERNVESVVAPEKPEIEKTTHEKNYQKSTDSTSYSTLQSEPATIINDDPSPIEGLDPKDITPPRR